MPYRDKFDVETPVEPIKVTVYKHGVRVHWKAKSARVGSIKADALWFDIIEIIRAEGNCTIVTKGKAFVWDDGWWDEDGDACGDPIKPPPRQIRSMSTKSRIRACAAFGNAPHPWSHLVTLTYPTQPTHPRADFDKLTREMRKTHNMNFQWGWVMEYQEREVVHYHIFLGWDWIVGNGYEHRLRTKTYRRDGKPRTVDCGALNDFFENAWVKAVGNTSEAFLRCQAGGIVEPFKSPDAAARYVAKEAGKKHQKLLPMHIEGGNRWWWLSKEGQPRVHERRAIDGWPLDKIYGFIFDKTILKDFLIDAPQNDE